MVPSPAIVFRIENEVKVDRILLEGISRYFNVQAIARSIEGALEREGMKASKIETTPFCANYKTFIVNPAEDGSRLAFYLMTTIDGDPVPMRIVCINKLGSQMIEISNPDEIVRAKFPARVFDERGLLRYLHQKRCF